MEVGVVEVKLQRVLGGHPDLDHALVDGGAGSGRALVVHRGIAAVLSPVSLVLFEDDDLRVLSAEFDDRPRVWVERLDRRA